MGSSLIILVVLIVLSGIFSSSEIAFFSISQAKLQALVEQKVKGAKSILKLKENSDYLLVTILIGNNIVNISASAIATLLATEVFGSSGAGIAVGVMTVLILIFGEITPKSFATRQAVSIARIMVFPLQFFQFILFPIIWIFVKINNIFTRFGGGDSFKVSEEEIHALAEIGVEHGAIEDYEHKYIKNILELDKTMVEQIMTPRVNMGAIDIEESLVDILPLIKKKEYSRYPVYKDSVDNIVGILYIIDLIPHIDEDFEKLKLSSVVRKPFFVPCTNLVDDLLHEMKVKRIHIAIVNDEHGGTAGLVTLEDVLEEIVGEIEDETDSKEVFIRKQSKNTWEISGKAELKVLEDFDLDFEDFHQSVSAFVIEKLEHMPKKDEVYETEDFTMKVNKLSDKLVEKVEFSLKLKKEDEIKSS